MVQNSTCGVDALSIYVYGIEATIINCLFPNEIPYYVSIGVDTILFLC